MTGNFAHPGRKMYLDLGEVKDMVEVRLNGKPLGIVCVRPGASTSARRPGPAGITWN